VAHYSQRGVPWPDAFIPKSVPTTAGVYALVCTPTKGAYVGSTLNLLGRLKTHFNALHTRCSQVPPALQDLYEGYGVDAFEVQVLEQFPDLVAEKGRRGSGAGTKVPEPLRVAEGRWFRDLALKGYTVINAKNEGQANAPLLLGRTGARYISRRHLLLHPEVIEQQAALWADLLQATKD
jgi:hypothetical protein